MDEVVVADIVFLPAGPKKYSNYEGNLLKKDAKEKMLKVNSDGEEEESDGEDENTRFLSFSNTLEDEEVEGTVDSDDEIGDSDIVAIGAINTLDAGTLQTFIYNEDEQYAYVHSDFILPTEPVVLAYIDGSSRESSADTVRYPVAVGSLNAPIMIWDMERLNAIEPIMTLTHTCSSAESTLSLAQCPQDFAWLSATYCSGNMTLWDIEAGSIIHDIKPFESACSTVSWSPVTKSILTTSVDGDILAIPSQGKITDGISFSIGSEPSVALWREEFAVVIATEDGVVNYYDLRNTSAPVLSWTAFSKHLTGLDITNINGEDIIVTTSLSGDVKVASVSGGVVNELKHEKVGLGKLYSVKFSPYSKSLAMLAANHLAVYDLEGIPELEDKFSNIESMSK